MEHELPDSGIHLMADGSDKVIVIMQTETSPGASMSSTMNASLTGGCSNANKRRPSKPQGPEYEYFKIVGERPNGKGYRLRCMFCDNREMNSHAPRMRKHLVYKCTGNVPEEVKDKFRNHKPVYTKNDERIRKSARKRTAIQFDSGNTSDEDDEDDDMNDTFTDKNRDPHMLMNSQNNITSSSSNNMMRKSEETTNCRKPVKQFTNEDFDREQKELQTKKMRLEVKIMEDQSKFWSKMGNGVDRVLKAVDLFIESQSRAAASAADQDQMSQVHTLYTHQDGSAVLQAAFAETISNNHVPE